MPLTITNTPDTAIPAPAGARWAFVIDRDPDGNGTDPETGDTVYVILFGPLAEDEAQDWLDDIPYSEDNVDAFTVSTANLASTCANYKTDRPDGTTMVNSPRWYSDDDWTGLWYQINA